jgi:8-amino-3,8-dideoxy-alpha-D-manno-octulosonate transaminase
MPGYELIGDDERDALIRWFEESNGVMFAHGFDARRNGVYKVREFERALAEHFGSPYAQAVSSGSSALVVALQALGVGPGDEVITQSFTFVATLEAIVHVGAVPVIAEIDDSLNLDPTKLPRFVTPRTKAIVPVHMAGAAADLDPILALARDRGLLVLEDTAQAVGGSYRGRPLGTIGDAGTFSFDFAKGITTGEGGLVLLPTQELFERARAFHDHGHEYNASLPRGRDTRTLPGFNHRMSEMQAAVGLVQLGKIDRVLEGQRRNKAALKERLKELELDYRRLNDVDGDVADTLIFFLDSEEQAAHAVARLTEQGVGTKNLPDALDWHFAATWQHFSAWLPTLAEQGSVACACHANAEHCPCGDRLRRAIALPVNVLMDDEELDRVAGAVAAAVEVAVA